MVIALLAFPLRTAYVAPPPSPREADVQRVLGVLSDRAKTMTPREHRRVAEAIVLESTVFGFDPLFVLAVIEAESGFDVEAVSRAGARGLMQIVPKTWRAFSESSRMFDPIENVRVGIRVLGDLTRRFKRPESLLLAYNAGPSGAGSIMKGEREHSSESRGYAPKVMRNYQRLLAAHGRDPKLARRSYIENSARR